MKFSVMKLNFWSLKWRKNLDRLTCKIVEL